MGIPAEVVSPLTSLLFLTLPTVLSIPLTIITGRDFQLRIQRCSLRFTNSLPP